MDLSYCELSCLERLGSIAECAARADFENVRRTVEFTRRYPNPKKSEIIKEKKLLK